jgi:hypothetical protein
MKIASGGLMFKTIPIYPTYEVDENSNVRSKSHKVILKNKKNGGYKSVGLSQKGSYKWHNCHRLCAMAWVGIPDAYESMDVAHNDGDRTNNHYSNLRWATRRENSHDRYLHGTARGAHSGELHHSSKLTVDAVIELRNRVRCGDRFMDVVNDMGIKKLTGYDACTGKTWRTVDSQSMPVNIKDAARATA